MVVAEPTCIVTGIAVGCFGCRALAMFVTFGMVSCVYVHMTAEVPEEIVHIVHCHLDMVHHTAVVTCHYNLGKLHDKIVPDHSHNQSGQHHTKALNQTAVVHWGLVQKWKVC